MKLFEIPVYALKQSTLKERYMAKRQKLIDEFDLVRTQNGNAQKIDNIVEMETYPQRLWNYNHIVGYIVISVNSTDISFDQFVPAHVLKRYYWDNKTSKTFLRSNHLSGYHFCYQNLSTDAEIRSRIHEMLEEIISKTVNQRFYVDREAFDQADRLMDYSRLLNNRAN